MSAHPEMEPPEHWLFYYLYSLERVGRVLGLDFIGTHEWYPEGAKYLLSTQKPDGSWIGKSEEEDPRLATSFALLFLTRSTQSLTAQEVKRGGEGFLKTGIQPVFGVPLGFTVLDRAGNLAASGPFGKQLTLPEGRYVFRTSYGGADYDQSFWINTERTTSVVFNAARIAKSTLKPAPQPAVKAKFCTECGKPTQPEAKFCSSCGAKVKG